MFAHAQIQTSPSSAPCTCDGSVSFLNPVPGSATYSVLDNTGLPLQIETNASGTFNFGGLCPSLFTLEIVQNGTTEILVFNIEGGNANPGSATETSICSTNGNSNLNGYVTGILAGGSWTDPNGNVHSGTFNPSNDSPGLYSYTVQSGGCDVVTGVLINLIQNADPGDYVNYLICEDYVPFLMTDWMDDPNGEWFDDLGNPISGWFDPASMNTATFVYMIDTVIGCPPVFASMTVTENLIPDAGTDATVLVCSNGIPFDMTDYLGGNPQTNGQWYDAFNNQVADIFDPIVMTEGVYRYRVNGQAPCNDVNSYLTIVFTDTNPSGSSASINLCSNGNAINMLDQLGGNPVAGGSWTNASNQVVDALFNPQNETAGNYFYYYPNVGCSPGNATLTIAVETLPNAGQNNSITICETTSSVNLTGYLSPGTNNSGAWTNDNNQIITPTVVITGPLNEVYTYTVNGNICPDDQSSITLVAESETPSPGNTQLTLCSESDPVDLNDLYSIDNLIFEDNLGNVISSIFDPASNNSQDITVISPSLNSCPDGSSVISIEVELPQFENDSIQIEVCNSTGVFDLNTTNNNINFANGNWFDASDIMVDSQIILNTEIQTTFYFESNAQDICEASVFFVEFNSFSPIDAGPDDDVVFCATDDAVLLASLLPIASGGMGQWMFENELFPEVQIDPETANSGIYAYTIPANGPCPADMAYLDVFIQNGITYSAGPDIEICQGDGLVIIGQDNPAGCTFEWSPAQNLATPLNSTTSVDIENTLAVPVTYSYEVEVSDGICVVQDTVQVTINPLPNPQLEMEYNTCFDEAIELNPNTSGNFTWEPASLFSDPLAPVQIFSPIDTVEVSVSVENQWGCSSQDLTTVIVHPVPYPVYLIETIHSCPPVNWAFALDSSSTNCDFVQWDFGQLGIYQGNSISSAATESGYYACELTVTSNFGCVYETSLGNVIEVYPSPQSDFEWEPLMVTTIDPIVHFVDLSEDALVYYWDFAGIDSSNVPEPVFEFPSDAPGNYDVCLTVYNEYYCSQTHCEVIHLENEYIFYAPNTFTPDNDGINDVFAPVLLGFDNSTFQLQIFNRWGEAIFTTNNVNQPWTGNVNGGSFFAEDGTYIWQVQVKDKENAEYRIFRGHLNLLR
ncbi:MAG: gliding motility-associated C-terminal domain-containing protein [Flavobacteriales bacterium]